MSASSERDSQSAERAEVHLNHIAGGNVDWAYE
jgi:hypothetical protein